MFVLSVGFWIGLQNIPYNGWWRKQISQLWRIQKGSSGLQSIRPWRSKFFFGFTNAIVEENICPIHHYDTLLNPVQEAKELFKRFDKDGNGTISFNEFLENLRVRGGKERERERKTKTRGGREGIVYVCWCYIKHREKGVLVRWTDNVQKKLYVHMAISVCTVVSLVTIVVTLWIPFVINKFPVLSQSANYMYTTAPSQRLGMYQYTFGWRHCFEIKTFIVIKRGALSFFRGHLYSFIILTYPWTLPAFPHNHKAP